MPTVKKIAVITAALCSAAFPGNGLLAHADTALIMSGTDNGNPIPFTNPEDAGYYGPTQAQMAATMHGYFTGDTMVPVNTPEQLFPLTGLNSLALSTSVTQGQLDLDAAIKATPGVKVVSGISQSALIVTAEKQALLTDPNAPAASDLSFVVEANPDRPNGGILTRFPELAALGLGPATAAPDTQYDTIDIAQQYDGIADFPNYPINLLADANAVAGIVYLHPAYDPDLSTLTPESTVTNSLGGTTTYYLVPTETLPLLEPLVQAGVPTKVVSTLNKVLKPLVDAGYDRNPATVGKSTPAHLLPKKSVIKRAIKAEVKAIKSLVKHTHHHGKKS